MTPIPHIAVAVLIALAIPHGAEPVAKQVALAVTDLTDPTVLPGHLRRLHPILLDNVHQEMRDLLRDLDRVETLNWRARFDGNRSYVFEGREEVDYVVHTMVHRLYKIYRNRVVYAHNVSHGQFASGSTLAANESQSAYEVLSLPAVIARIEVRLIDRARNKALWSGMRDTTVHLNYDLNIFIYNPEKYPGWTPEHLVRSHMASFLRLQDTNSSVGAMLRVADRWFLSDPAEDVETSRSMLSGLVGSFYNDLDGNLPLEARIDSLAVQGEETRALLSIGAAHGLAPKHRLDVRRSHTDEKVGQLEVIRVDSVSAVARLRKLEKKIRKRGEGLLLSDRVISRRRTSNRSRTP
ncbi:MAG: hypothetical protein VX733_15255 [Candidatus Latescibacterota bacterium]|nr:hypothetical protein [Candidatus Latescibacterota bacterium]